MLEEEEQQEIVSKKKNLGATDSMVHNEQSYSLLDILKFKNKGGDFIFTFNYNIANCQSMN